MVSKEMVHVRGLMLRGKQRRHLEKGGLKGLALVRAVKWDCSFRGPDLAELKP